MTNNNHFHRKSHGSSDPCASVSSDLFIPAVLNPAVVTNPHFSIPNVVSNPREYFDLYHSSPPSPPPNPYDITYITFLGTAQSIPPSLFPSGLTLQPTGTTFPSIQNVISNFTAPPSVNVGRIRVNGGYFSVPVSGQYLITASIQLTGDGATVSPPALREVYIFKAVNNLNYLLAYENGYSTESLNEGNWFNISTIAELCANDSIIFVVTQSSITTVIYATINSRFTITKL